MTQTARPSQRQPLEIERLKPDKNSLLSWGINDSMLQDGNISIVSSWFFGS